jgi:hypothetical protein
MTFHWVSNNYGDFFRSSVGSTTNGGASDTNFCAEGIVISNGGGDGKYIKHTFDVPQTAGFFHCVCYYTGGVDIDKWTGFHLISGANTVNANEIVSGGTYTIVTAGTTDWIAIGSTGSTVGTQFTATGTGTGTGTASVEGGIRLHFTNGAHHLQAFNVSTLVWDTLDPAPIEFGSGVLQRIDIEFGTNLVRFYVNEVMWAEYTGSTANYIIGNMTAIRCNSAENFLTSTFSEFLWADESTLDIRVSQLTLSGAGDTHNDWNGTYVDANNGAGVDDGTFIYTSVANDLQQFELTDLSAAAMLLDIIGVVVPVRVRNDGNPPTDIQISLRTGALDFFSPTVTTLNTGIQRVDNQWLLNPNTVAKWTPAEINALQIGPKAI